MAAYVTFLALLLPWLNPFSPGPTPAVMPWLFSLACFAFVLPGAARLPPAELVKVVAGAWLAAALMSALFGLLQYFGFTALFAPWIDATAMGEAYGNLRQRNQFATLTNIGLAALLWWVAQAWPAPMGGTAAGAASAQGAPGSAGRARWPAGLGALAAAVLLAWANAASSSRTGLVQLVLLVVITWGWQAREPDGGERGRWLMMLVLAAGLAYALASVLLPGLVGLDSRATGILSRLHDGGPGCASRLTLWSNVLHLIAQKPWFGWGWGGLNYAHFITVYPGTRFCEILDNAHNLPLHLAVELGLPLALLLCVGALWLVWRERPWRETQATRQLAWAVLAVILLHSLLEYPLWYGPFQTAAALALWLLARGAPGNSRIFVTNGSLALVLPWLVATCFIAIAAYSMWDYQRISQIYLNPGQRWSAYREHTLEKISDSRLYRDQVRFAELTATELTKDNAAHMHALALVMLHFSPEPRVVEVLIESATLIGRDAEARFYLARYRAAFPESHARWAAGKS